MQCAYIFLNQHIFFARYEGEEDTDFNFKQDFISFSSDLSRRERFQLGHQLSTMFISCTWQGKKCKARYVSSLRTIILYVPVEYCKIF